MVNQWSIFNQLLFPDRCSLCDSNQAQSQQIGLCEACITSLPWLQQACQRCALPLTHMAAQTRLCGNCQQKPPAFEQCHALFHYQYPVDRLITQLKFNQKLLHARLFGLLLAQHIGQQYQNQALPDMLIPVPLHRRRLRERGFNQAQEIARLCASKLGVVMHSKQCCRSKHTDHQPGLSATERRRNVRNAFTCRAFTKGTRVALVDDVMTTGTTLNELSRCLKDAGCEEIHLWCVARAHHE